MAKWNGMILMQTLWERGEVEGRQLRVESRKLKVGSARAREAGGEHDERTREGEIGIGDGWKGKENSSSLTASGMTLIWEVVARPKHVGW
jgi:hypothetical protein